MYKAEIIGITGSDEYRASVAEILSYDLRAERLSGYSSKDYDKLCDLTVNGKKDYFIVEGPSLFSDKKLSRLVDHKFYIADEANDKPKEHMVGVVVLESPGKTAFYYRNRIMESLNL